MMANGCTVTSGCVNTAPRSYSLVRCYPKAALPISQIRLQRDHKLKFSSPRASSSLHAPTFPASPFSKTQHSLSRAIPWMTTRRNEFASPKASNDVPSSFRYPPMTKKPKFWWRILACIPYLMPLHETWMYAETAYHLHPFLEDFEFMTYPFLGVIGSLPSWFLMAYFFVGYLFIVRRKEWPHFFRFHVILGMLLEIFLQVLGTASRWLPKSYYNGKLGQHFWLAAAFAHLFTVLECIRCAICGMYADVPFASDAAYIQMPYD